MAIILQAAWFLTSYLGLNLSFLGIKNDSFGAGMVTSVGMLNMVDAIAPLTRKNI